MSNVFIKINIYLTYWLGHTTNIELIIIVQAHVIVILEVPFVLNVLVNHSRALPLVVIEALRYLVRNIWIHYPDFTCVTFSCRNIFHIIIVLIYVAWLLLTTIVPISRSSVQPIFISVLVILIRILLWWLIRLILRRSRICL